MKNQGKQKKKVFSEESIESKPLSVSGGMQDMGRGIADSFWKDVLGGSLDSSSKMILGDAQLQEGQEVSLKKQSEEKQGKVVTSEHMQYVRTTVEADRSIEGEFSQTTRQQMDEIRSEIKKLSKTNTLLERTIKDATVDKAPIKPGKYHVAYFSFVLSVLRDATQKIEDAVSFGSVFQSKKQQSKYWNSAKKSGTSFTLSSERSTATQTG